MWCRARVVRGRWRWKRKWQIEEGEEEYDDEKKKKPWEIGKEKIRRAA